MINIILMLLGMAACGFTVWLAQPARRERVSVNEWWALCGINFALFVANLVALVVSW